MKSLFTQFESANAQNGGIGFTTPATSHNPMDMGFCGSTLQIELNKSIAGRLQIVMLQQ